MAILSFRFRIDIVVHLCHFGDQKGGNKLARCNEFGEKIYMYCLFTNGTELQLILESLYWWTTEAMSTLHQRIRKAAVCIASCAEVLWEE